MENSTFEIGPFTIQSSYVIHPGPTVGYRIKGRHSVFTYIPDHEPALGQTGIIANNKWVSGIDLASGADLLLHDAQYTGEEYQIRKGWGHSSLNDTMLFASIAGVKHLLLAHHDPSHSDLQLNAMFEMFRKNTGYQFKYELAREGTEMILN